MTSAQPTASICIPAYSRPGTLREAIASVLAQDFTDVEVIVGDDSGELEPVAAKFDDARLRYHRNPRRLGMAGNWNAVLDRARGRFVGLMMDDDRLLPGFLTQTVSALEAEPSVGLAFTDHYFADGSSLRRRRCSLAGGTYDPFLETLLEHKPVAVSAALLRREVWSEIRPLPDLLTADVVMHVRIALAGWAARYVDEPLMIYRTHAGQLSSREEAFREDRVRAWDLFTFRDPRAEALRRRYLGRALVDRAATHVKARRYEAAAADVARARHLGVTSLRGRLVDFIAHHPALGPPAHGMVHAAKRARHGLQA